ncbi:tegument protein UL7 [Vespertilionid gammaherpesvirus 1]|uniref:Tegument protein UL7 n=1 Tax=Vespertilionid gammaherpesvirus 1 TaxID=2560830 RepID=A0A0X9XSM0_9GAMA|nr:tegument protein UL7 [Myotis gammaherpesvirus 8]AMA67397.1 tegument protein UL7 [Vespertilionid gammaherpesvirus 1]
MEQAINMLTGQITKPSEPEVQKHIKLHYPHPSLPRMVLEVNRTQSLCLAISPTPTWKNGEIHVPSLVNYVKNKMDSDTFFGFVMVSLLECEDLVDSLDIYPHIFSQRTFLFYPSNACIFELCILTSILENIKNPTLNSVLSLLKRARYIYSKNPSLDCAFMLHGIEVIGSTILQYFDLDPDKKHTFYPGLLLYKMHKALENGTIESKGLLKPIYTDSYKMITDTDSSFDDNEEMDFNVFYSDTIFTHHLKCETVLRIFKDVCVSGHPKSQILS